MNALAFSYLRVSSQGQVDKDGPERQRESIKNFCDKHAVRRIGEYFEEGISGTTEAMARPAFSEMIAKILFLREANIGSVVPIVDSIVVESLSRLARDLMVSEFLLRECRNNGIKVFCADQGELVDMASQSNDPTRTMLRQILGAVAQWEKSVLVLKLKAARDRLRQAGQRCDGKKPYGFHPGEKEVLAKVTDLRNSGLSYEEIARYLNAGGIKTRHGKKWKRLSVYGAFSGRNQTLKRNKSCEDVMCNSKNKRVTHPVVSRTP